MIGIVGMSLPDGMEGRLEKVRSFGEAATKLARNPLGIIALFLVLTYAMAALVVGAGSLTPEQKNPLIYFLVGFPILVLMVFTWLVINHSGKLFAPSDYKNGEHYAALQRTERLSAIEFSARPVESNTALAPPADSKTAPITEVKQPDISDDDSWITPQASWERSEYEHAIFYGLVAENNEIVESIRRAYLEHVNKKQPADGLTPEEWQADIESMRIQVGKLGDLGRLRKLARDHPDSSNILEYLARGLRHFEEFSESASAYEAALAKATTTLERLRLMAFAAVDRNRSGAIGIATDIISQMKFIVAKEGEGERILLVALLDIAELNSDERAAISAMERMVETKPEDIRIRFQLAYKHAEKGRNDLALMHYLAIPLKLRDANAWNNMGVEFKRLDLVGMAVGAYRKSEELGETLAMSNLAEQLLSGGFFAEAQELCDRALTMKDPHQNVAHTLSRLKGLPGDEEKKKEELLKTAKPKADFYKKLGKALVSSEPADIEPLWRGPDCILSVTLDGSAFAARGLYDQPPNALVGALMGGINLPPSRMKVENIGTLRGRTIEGYLTRIREGQSLTVLDTAGHSTEFVMEISVDGSEIKVMEQPKAAASKIQAPAARFYSLTREAPSSS
jgi:tetratricopeptide (TPR) repeat protein